MIDLNEFAVKLNCADEAERTYAAEDIGYLNAPEGVPALVDRLGKEASRAVRDAIFQALIRIEADAAIEGAIGLLESEDPQIRNQAVDVLRRKGAHAVPFLHTVMRDGDKDVRKLVLDILREVQTGDAEDIYAAALSDPDPNVVMTAVENLGGMRAKEFRVEIENLLQAGTHPMLDAACLEALAGIGDEASLEVVRRRFPELATLPDFFLVPCLKAMAALGSDGDFARVAGLLPTRSPHLRPAILSALIGIYSRYPSADRAGDLLVALRKVVENGDPPLCRYQAMGALGLLAARDDVYEFLISCLSNPERLIRLGAIESLRGAARQGLDEVLQFHAANETDEEVRQALGC
jgi:hypothetical protein